MTYKHTTKSLERQIGKLQVIYNNLISAEEWIREEYLFPQRYENEEVEGHGLHSAMKSIIDASDKVKAVKNSLHWTLSELEGSWPFTKDPVSKAMAMSFDCLLYTSPSPRD